MQKLNIDMANKWLSAIQSVVIIIGLLFTVLTLSQLVDQTKIQNETLAETQAGTSAEYALEMEDRLDGPEYTNLYTALENGNQKTPILDLAEGGSGGPFTQTDIEDYIDNLDDIGALVRSGVISQRMAYDDFSDQTESAWCNNDVQKVIQNDRVEDHSKTAVSDPYYDDFQYLATTFLIEDGGCVDAENQ